MKRMIYSCIALIFILAGCSNNVKKQGEVVVSIPPQTYIVESLLGDDAAVTTVAGSDVNPESFEPAMSTMMALAQAEVYFPVGTLEFEEKLTAESRKRFGNLRIVESAGAVNLLYGTHGDCDNPAHHHGNEAPDPHIWSTPSNMKKIAARMADELASVYPEKKDSIFIRLSRLYSRLDSLDLAMRKAVASDSLTAFMVWHPSLSYFANEYGLQQITIGTSSKELSAKQLAAILDEAEEHNASVLFVQKEFDASRSSLLKNKNNIRIVEINPMDKDWESEFRTLIKAFDGTY